MRVTRPGGGVVILEIAEPRGRVGRFLYRTWFSRIIPVLGRLAGAATAYRYVPGSVDAYPAPERIAALLAEAGLEDVRWVWLATGLATLHAGRKPDR